MNKLYETYERCNGAPQFEKKPLPPVGHIEQQAHIEIVLDHDGIFRRASVLEKERTLVPATEDSAGRSGMNPKPHPLCDKIRTCAKDYPAFGGKKTASFDGYIAGLRAWQTKKPNPKVNAVLRYVERGTVVRDLVQAQILYCGDDQRLLTEWDADNPPPPIFKLLPKQQGNTDQGDAFVRWRVQLPGDLVSALWEDPEVHRSWIEFLTSAGGARGFCMVTGETTTVAENHPKGIRREGDQAKLLSSNDTTGFTFRGRFEKPVQAFCVGAVVSQKAHGALRWLIERQGYRTGSQVFLAWAISGSDVPGPLLNTAEAFGLQQPDESASLSEYGGDAGQHFSVRLKRAIAGYRAHLSGRDEVIVMGLDSATPGRIAITCYREFTGLEFLDRVEDWHTRYAWRQNYGRSIRFTGAPAPPEIAEAAYGRRLDDKLKKATIERLLPCIVDARPLPRDLLDVVVRRVCNRCGIETWEWEKCLGISCALVRGCRRKEQYEMSLEGSRDTRDYLFGRLLAIAENIEERALYIAKEKRDTTAARLMQRFATRPYSTWRTIELSLVPYKTRLRANRPGTLLDRHKLLDTVVGMFHPEDYTSDRQLSGEFLLGYHCQRDALWNKQGSGDPPEQNDTETEGANE